MLCLTIYFTLLSYNVHGLSALIAQDHPRMRMETIGPFLQDYPIVLIQEDFAYHRSLRRAVMPDLTFRGNESRFGFFSFFLKPLCGTCGSGLTAFVRENTMFVPIVHGYGSFGSICSGWIRKKSDCWATKGFIWVKLLMKNGVEIAVYNLHLDAGTDKSDKKARKRQLHIVGDHIARHVPMQMPLIVAGDFNSNAEELEPFLTLCNLKEGFHHGIDHIFFHTSSRGSLTFIQGGDATGIPNLSDHRPIYATFGITSFLP